jgi:excisionase family DNA binding protein
MALNNINADKVGWRVNEWADDVGLGRAFTYQLIQEGRIKSVKVGGARIITTRPDEFLRSAAQGNEL